MAEDRFANIFTAEVVQTAANTLTFAELQFGITLRDRIAIAIDEVYFYVNTAALALMTTANDRMEFALSVSDQPTSLSDLSDRRILHATNINRIDMGTAASGMLIKMPLKESFAPPMIVLPNRIYVGIQSAGLASVVTLQMRMHYRTVPISRDDQLIEVLESFQLST